MERRRFETRACLGLPLVARLTIAALGLATSCQKRALPASTVAVPAPSASDDAGTRVAQEQDASFTDAALPNARGPTPAWPQTEQESTLAYQAGPTDVQLSLDPSPSQLDLQMNIDTTASFGGEIDELQYELTRSIVPALRARVADASFGVSKFADFPVAPFGNPGKPPNGDVPFVLLTPITSSLSAVSSAVAKLDMPLGQGGDTPEAGAEALYQLATGSGFKLDGQPLIAPYSGRAAVGGGTSGGVGFRSEALHVVVHATDAISHEPPDYSAFGIGGTHSMSDAIAQLQSVQAHVIGICSTSQDDPDFPKVLAELSSLAVQTGALMAPVNGGCATGIDGAQQPPQNGKCPLVFIISPDGSGLANSLVDAVVGLLDSVQLSEVHAEVGDDPLGFIRAIALAPLPQPPGVPTPATADRLPAIHPDGVPDTYLNVSRANALGFAITLQNDRIAPSDVPQHFRVSVRLIGDGIRLEERYLGVVVPAGPPQPRAAVEDDAGPP